MKHRVQGKKLNRDVHSRRSLFKNLLRDLITYQHLQTSLAKAKAIQGQFDGLMVKAQEGTVNSRRQIDLVLNDRRLVNKLVDEIAPTTKLRHSGFTRLIRVKRRLGDNSIVVRLELVDYKAVAATPEPKGQKKAEKAKKVSLTPTKVTNNSAPKSASPLPSVVRKTP